MEQGAKSLLMILCVALLLGAVVIGVNPSYRKALASIWEGRPAESPIWQSNIAYYPDVSLEGAGAAAGEAGAAEAAAER